MKLLLISPVYPPYTGGTATFARLLIPHLKNAEELEKIFIFTEYFKAVSYTHLTLPTILRV